MEDILSKRKQALADDPEVRGDPLRFTDNLSLLSCQNEQKYDRDPFFKACGQFLAQFPEGAVSIFGPGTADTWWPESVGSAKSVKWEKLSQLHFNIITDNCPHPWSRGTAALQQLTLRRGVDKNGKAWTDYYFADIANNTFYMSMILTR